MKTSNLLTLGLASSFITLAVILSSGWPRAVQADTPAGTAAEESGKSGAELWKENCMRCHNLPPPAKRSNAEWEVTLFHMRVRAMLTADEHHKILQFMKSSKN